MILIRKAKPGDEQDGTGNKLFEKVAAGARSKIVRRMEWQVYDWNQTAIDFYLKLNAQLNSE